MVSWRRNKWGTLIVVCIGWRHNVLINITTGWFHTYLQVLFGRVAQIRSLKLNVLIAAICHFLKIRISGSNFTYKVELSEGRTGVRRARNCDFGSKPSSLWPLSRLARRSRYSLVLEQILNLATCSIRRRLDLQNQLFGLSSSCSYQFHLLFLCDWLDSAWLRSKSRRRSCLVGRTRYANVRVSSWLAWLDCAIYFPERKGCVRFSTVWILFVVRIHKFKFK